jgi:hypothetical protein
MKYLAVVALLCVSMVGFAQDKKSEVKKEAKAEVTKLHGYVVDQMCAKGMAKKGNPMERAAKHTKECALEEACAASGFGLFYGDNKWVKFDENGDKLAKAMFEKSKKDKDFMVDVTGEAKGDRFAVASLTESMMSSDEMKKPMKKEESHEGHKH